MAKDRRVRWTDDDDYYLRTRYGFEPISAIARHLGKSEMSVRCYISRKRISPDGPIAKRNLLVMMIERRFRHKEDFTQRRLFYDYTGLTRQRYYALYSGRRVITPEELRKVSEYLGCSCDDLIDARPVSMFTDRDF